MQDERRLAVLRAIVQDYVSTQEPVGSKALVERHTSAGRVPTDAGYRMFVDRLTAVKPLTVGEKRAIETFLDGAVDLDDVVQRSVRLLAQLTRQVAIVQYPTLSGSTVRHVELVALAPSRLLAVLILSTGRVEQRLVDLGAELTDDEVAELRVQVQRATLQERIADAATALGRLAGTVAHERRMVVSRVADTLVEAMSDHRSDERVVVGGTANLTRFGEAFDTSLKPLLEALEEHVVLLKLLGEASTSPTVTVRIGHEGPLRELAATSVVASGYGSGTDALAALGIVGPTRMDYPGTMAAVRAVARYVSAILDEA